ncbi:hypothetical protein VNO77_27624 [Canavalia gladiata]|uniref:Uncharacterized protein n=1 Tax=Canavalia gladiata TaxID=3824 RepID=A0AAN9KV01_CANGL
MGETGSMERKPNLNRVCIEKGKIEVGVCIKGRQHLLIRFCHNGRDSKGDLESLSCTDLDSKDPFGLDWYHNQLVAVVKVGGKPSLEIPGVKVQDLLTNGQIHSIKLDG